MCSNIKNGGGNGSCCGYLTPSSTELKLYNTVCAEFWKLCFLGNRQPSLHECQFVCRDGSRVPARVRRLRTTWSGKLSDSLVTQQSSTSTTKLKEGIVGVDGTSNQAVNR